MKNPIDRWLVVFVLANMAFIQWQSYNDNAIARLAAMCAFTETHTFQIDPYIVPVPWTKDWALGPDHHAYSNKPPIPILVGEPVFWIVDQVLMHGVPNDPAARQTRRQADLPIYNWILSMLLQVLPFALLVGIALTRLQRQGVSRAALQITAAAMLFGNTAAVLMNLYFGHPMAACCTLAAALAIESEAWAWAAFFVSAAMFCDYGAVALLPGFVVVALWRCDAKLKRLATLALGAIVPTTVAGIYHTICFGRPWRTALQFEAPEWVDLAGKPHTFWGLFHMWPNPHALVGLIFSPARGILFTQPWILLVILSGFYALKSERVRSHTRLALFALSGIIMIWIANGFFGQWHGGWTIGPRYMSSIFPTLALLGGMLYDEAPSRLKTVAWILVGVSLVLTVLIFTGTPYVPQNQALWIALVRDTLHNPLARTLFRVGVLGVGWIWAIAVAK